MRNRRLPPLLLHARMGFAVFRRGATAARPKSLCTRRFPCRPAVGRGQAVATTSGFLEGSSRVRDRAQDRRPPREHRHLSSLGLMCPNARILAPLHRLTWSLTVKIFRIQVRGMSLAPRNSAARVAPQRRAALLGALTRRRAPVLSRVAAQTPIARPRMQTRGRAWGIAKAHALSKFPVRTASVRQPPTRPPVRLPRRPGTSGYQQTTVSSPPLQQTPASTPQVPPWASAGSSETEGTRFRKRGCSTRVPCCHPRKVP